jgi:hypothetical protein
MDENVLYIKSIGLDGSVRSEERFLAINNFNVNEDTFIFLLSTKAGMENRIDFYKVYISIVIKVVLV